MIELCQLSYFKADIKLRGKGHFEIIKIGLLLRYLFIEAIMHEKLSSLGGQRYLAVGGIS